MFVRLTPLRSVRHECRTIEYCPLTLLHRNLRSHVLKLQRKIA